MGDGRCDSLLYPLPYILKLRVCAFAKWKSGSMDSVLPPFFVWTLLDGMILMQLCCFKFFYILPICIFIGRWTFSVPEYGHSSK